MQVVTASAPSSTTAKYPFRTDRQGAGQAGRLLIYGKEAEDDEKDDEKDGGKRLVPVKSGMVKVESAEDGPEDPPAGALFRSHAARRHGRRGQDHRRRRTARGDAGEEELQYAGRAAIIQKGCWRKVHAPRAAS